MNRLGRLARNFGSRSRQSVLSITEHIPPSIYSFLAELGMWPIVPLPLLTLNDQTLTISAHRRKVHRHSSFFLPLTLPIYGRSLRAPTDYERSSKCYEECSHDTGRRIGK